MATQFSNPQNNPLGGSAALSFRYPGAERAAVSDLTLELYPGELHLLVGENGAGKSTLAKLLAGLIEAPDISGELHLPRAVYLPQHLMSYRETIFADYLWLYFSQGNSALKSWNSPDARRRRLEDVLHAFLGAELAREILVEQVSRVSSNILHLYTAFILLSRDDLPVLIFDEPTAVLSESEALLFFRAASLRRDEGQSILLITHRLGEALTFADRISIMRQGTLTGSRPAESFGDIDEIYSLMFGTSSARTSSRASSKVRSRVPDRMGQSGAELSGVIAPAGEEPVLSLDDISSNFPDLCSLKHLSLTVRPGEIHSVSGIRDEGLEQLERLLSGRSGAYRGKARYRDHELSLTDIRALRQHAVGFVPGERKRFGAAPAARGYENIGILFRDHREISRRPRSGSPGDRSGSGGPAIPESWLQRFRRFVNSRFQAVDLDLNIPAREYSGGMLQRLILQRETAGSSRHDGELELLILSNPGWGLDPLQKERFHRRLRSLAEEGVAILLLTTELQEALELGDRISFLHSGRIFEPDPGHFSNNEKMEAFFLGQFPEGADNA